VTRLFAPVFHQSCTVPIRYATLNDSLAAKLFQFFTHRRRHAECRIAEPMEPRPVYPVCRKTWGLHILEPLLHFTITRIHGYATHAILLYCRYAGLVLLFLCQYFSTLHQVSPIQYFILPNRWSAYRHVVPPKRLIFVCGPAGAS